MPLAHLNKRQYSHIVVIIPGPKEPSSLAPYLTGVLQDFADYGPPRPAGTVGNSEDSMMMLLCKIWMDDGWKGCLSEFSTTGIDLATLQVCLVEHQ